MKNDLRSVGTVTRLNGNKAEVVFKRTKACGSCEACLRFGTDEAAAEIKNTLNAKVGDRVEIAIRSGSMLKAGFILYLIPLAALVIGVYFGCRINDIAGALIGIGAALITLVIIHLFEPRFKRMGIFEPAMLRIINEKEE